MIWPEENMDYFAVEALSGMLATYPDEFQLLHKSKNSAVLAKRKLNPQKVSVIVSGGAGNGPLFTGFVGPGLADAVVAGAPFAAPNAYAIYEAVKAIGGSRGALLIYNNFAGDFLNNDMAEELLEMEGIRVAHIISHDDIATAHGEVRENRNGRCGVALLIKLAGLLSEQGMSLDELELELEAAASRIATLSLNITPGTNSVVLGQGFSGEPGVCAFDVKNRKEAASVVIERILDDLKPETDEELFFMLNRQRMTSYADAFIMAKEAFEILNARHPVKTLRVGAYSNISDTYGFTFTVMAMNKRWSKLLDEPIATDSFRL